MGEIGEGGEASRPVDPNCGRPVDPSSRRPVDPRAALGARRTPWAGGRG